MCNGCEFYTTDIYLYVRNVFFTFLFRNQIYLFQAPNSLGWKENSVLYPSLESYKNVEELNGRYLEIWVRITFKGKKRGKEKQASFEHIAWYHDEG